MLSMIPLDHRFSNALRYFERNRFVYTRYADDILISCQRDFDKDKVQAFIANTLREMGAPFTLKPEKTRYGSSAGRKWNLRVMLNKDNEITIGHKKKKHFKAMLDGYIRAKRDDGAGSFTMFRCSEDLSAITGGSSVVISII